MDGRTKQVAVFTVVGLTVAALGAATAIDIRVLAAVAVIATAALFLTASPLVVLAVLVVTRTLSDSKMLPGSVSFGVNLLIALFVIGYAVGYFVLRRFVVGQIVLWVPIGALLSSIYALWLVDGTSSILNEYTRLVSIVGMACLAVVVRRDVGDLKVAQALVLASFPAATFVFFGEITKTPEFYNAAGGAFGTFANKNAAAGMFAVVAVVSLYAFLMTKQKLFAAGCISSVAAMVLNVSLGGAITGCVGIAVLLLGYRQRITFGTRVVLSLGVLGALVLLASNSSYIKRFSEIDDSGVRVASAGEQTNSLNWRLSNWSRLLEIWQDRPLFGWGFGSTSRAIQPLGKQPHSEYVRFLVEVGLVGFVVLVLLAWLILRSPVAKSSMPFHIALSSLVLVNATVANTLAYVPMMYIVVIAWQVRDLSPIGAKDAVLCDSSPGPFGHQRSASFVGVVKK
ncbi:hypothetical protein BH93_24420 [Rhodococcoides fascians A25f]|uniref:O-antigen ligase family protein n=1 Tax=Rhodococcoides fascians TaxID=1828 RepID=UPI000569923C|nr:O-antigen ligase family protein [Rhodococcus fascians]QII08115.1 hypothetical protein BH93_24420 [Rhodococcus fascians A25f]